MILIIDGNNMAYRALFKFTLATSEGENISVLYGFLRMMMSMVKKHHPKSVVVAFDGGSPKYRKAILPEYKAHRERDDSVDWDSVFHQIDQLRTHILPKMGVGILHQRGIEADDLMAQMAKVSLDRPYIVTTDNDLLQMVSPSISVITPIKGKIYTYDNFEEIFGIAPELYVYHKIFVGDSSDNIPGVSSIGKITAVKLLLDIDKHWNGYTDDMCDLLFGREWKCLNTRQKKSLEAFGHDKFMDMYELMDLWADRSGASRVIEHADWAPADLHFVKNYFVRHEFVSLLGADNLRPFSRLVRPEGRLMQCPVYPIKRTPCEVDDD